MYRSFNNQKRFPIVSVLKRSPNAIAEIKGSKDNPQITGNVKLYQTHLGVIVYAEIKGLPEEQSICGSRIFAFHIHKGSECSGDMNDPFSNAMSHYNPDNCEHPYHAGDLPPLFSNNGYAFSIFLTDRFSVNEVIGKTVIIHDRPDDFTTQPSGNSGTKIACGVIRRSNVCDFVSK
ncbi:MAG: superoxide dismutase family protein [Ruminococcus sp.]|nr:superoxide dismutase family protein [Ruminococcus sp.]